MLSFVPRPRGGESPGSPQVPLPDPRDADPDDEALARFLRVTLRSVE